MLKVITFTIVAIIASGARASDLGINYSAANDLLLTAPSCEELVSQHQSICNWKKNIEPSFKTPVIQTSSCKKISSKSFSMIVSSCLPEFVKANQHKKLFKSGANCWGTALSFKKISNRPRFIWSQEMKYWLDSPVCRKLAPKEQKLPGDIINTFGPEYIFEKDEASNKGIQFWEALFPGRLTAPQVDGGYSGYHNFLHSETFISDKLAFGKDSPNQLDRFEFHPMNEVYGRSKDVDCQENQTRSPHYRENQNPPRPIKGSKCDYFSLAYRCENFENYFAKQTLTASDEDNLATIKRLQAVQDKLFPLLTIAGKTFPKNEISQMVKEADLIAKESLEELKIAGDKNREMILTLKFFTANGIRKSLELADLIPPTEAL
ncbi:hypothetical protein [Peredibacter starrii]|uniref:Uncharacterized protein n=1 Tax=Peredibacter starrii TaxID=28202 RepID=A0AAX4HNQ4_9BACT|nr:hypothetical protein [Peredibacter starrii]WPU64882.1 hypothetical protein SOO65_19490 [Peredibacter starrii]